MGSTLSPTLPSHSLPDRIGSRSSSSAGGQIRGGPSLGPLFSAPRSDRAAGHRVGEVGTPSSTWFEVQVREPRPPRTIPLPQGVGVHGKREKFLGDEELLKHWIRRKASMSPNQLNAWSFVTQFLSMISSAYGSSILILDSVITPSVSYTRIRATNPRPSPRPRRSPSTSILSQRHSAYMEFAGQQLFDWNQRVAGVTEHNSRMTQLMFASMATGQIPTMEPPPPPPGPQPVLPTFEQFLAEHYNGTPGTGGSSAGGGATDGSTPESWSPVTPVWRGPGGGGGGGGSASASGDDLGFGDLGFGSGSDAA